MAQIKLLPRVQESLDAVDEMIQEHAKKKPFYIDGEMRDNTISHVKSLCESDASRPKSVTGRQAPATRYYPRMIGKGFNINEELSEYERPSVFLVDSTTELTHRFTNVKIQAKSLRGYIPPRGDKKLDNWIRLISMHMDSPNEHLARKLSTYDYTKEGMYDVEERSNLVKLGMRIMLFYGNLSDTKERFVFMLRPFQAEKKEYEAYYAVVAESFKRQGATIDTDWLSKKDKDYWAKSVFVPDCMLIPSEMYPIQYIASRELPKSIEFKPPIYSLAA